jgi:alcohol dehydrogenase/L-iditol 2-dehydrogenase
MCVNSRIQPGDLVVVIGPGPIGLLCARMAALSGADPLIVAGVTADAPRLEAARRLGATRTVDVQTEDLDGIVRGYSSIGADLVCDASGASRALGVALPLARPDGQVTKVGWSPEVVATDVNPLVQRNLRLQGSFSHNYPVWERVIQLLDRGVTLPETIVGLRAPLEQWSEAFDAMHEGRVIKSVLVPNQLTTIS